jgi:nitrogen fixation negative regulator NifL
MISKRLRVVVLVAIPVLATGVFVADLLTPPGITHWVWYFIPLLLSVYIGSRFLPFQLAAVFSVLALAGFFLSPPGMDPRLALISRCLGICAMWLVAVLIHQRQQTHEKVRKLSRAVEQSPVSIVITDQAGNIEYVNPKFTEVTGYSFEEVSGKNPRILKSGEMPPAAYRRLWETITAGREWRGEFHNRKKGGELFWESASISPIFDAAGHVTHFLAVKEDITEHKRTAHHLTETLDFNQKIISDASVGIVVFKASGRCVLANEAAARIINATVPQLLAQDFRQLEPWRVSGMLKFAEEALAAGKPQQCEPHFVTTFGKEVWLVCHLTPFVQGNEPHLLLLFNDATEKKKLEAQFLRSQRMESIGTLAGGIAHDLNNVLTPILVSIQMLKEKVTDDDGLKLLETLETNAQRGAGLVKQVLGFGRGVQGERIMIHPKHIAHEIGRIVDETFPKSVESEFHSADDLWTITGDPTQLHQVLLNLCVNARDAMPDGGKLSIHMENAVLDEIYAGLNLEAQPGPYVLINVTDSGMGIPKEIQERIFDPFFTTKAPGKGTGLGLSTTLAIVKSHGGFINCYSEPGKGTTFKVYFPANTTMAATEPLAVVESRLPHGRNELVLVVDDEESIRKLTQRVLERFGYRVLLAVDGAEAVSLYTPRRKEIDVVIIDMSMPIMDGPAAIVALKAVNPEVRIISSSGASDGGTAKVRDAGVRHFIPKPYTAETMLNTLHEVLHGNHAN